MNADGMTGQNLGKDICTVCGINARECRESFSHLRHQAKLISICSRKCMETFQREPDRFAADERARPLRREDSERFLWVGEYAESFRSDAEAGSRVFARFVSNSGEVR